jgi:hypothetical protein
MDSWNVLATQPDGASGVSSRRPHPRLALGPGSVSNSPDSSSHERWSMASLESRVSSRNPAVFTVAVLIAWAIGCGGGGSQAYPDVVGTGGRGASDAGSGDGAGSGGRANTGGVGNGMGGAGVPDGSVATDGGGVPIAIPDYGAQLIAANCAFYSRCGLFPTAVSCQASINVGTGFVTLQADVASGRVLYDAAQAGACADSIRNAPCGIAAQAAANALPSPCAAVFTGTVAPGAVCFTSDECSGASVCVLAAACPAGCCAGTCVAPVAAGGNCAGAPCPTGTYCRATSTATTTTFRCTPQATSLGAVCDAADGCVPPLFCVPDGSGTGTCARSLPATGGACDQNAGCDDSHDYCDASGICVKLVDVGLPCTTTPFDNCTFYSDCVAGICKARGGAGAACVSDLTTGASDCLGSLLCPSPGMTCTAPPAAVSCR